MTKFRKTALALGVAAIPVLGSAVAFAAEPLAILFAGPGGPPAIVVLAPSAPVAPPVAVAAADPAIQAMRAMQAMMPADDIAQIIAQQNAMMQRVMQQMDASFSAVPFPGQLIPGQPGPGQLVLDQPGTSSVVVTSVSNGSGSCSQVVTTAYDGGQPHVTVRRTGSACEALPLPQMRTVPADVPAAPEIVPDHNSPRLIQVDHRKPAPQRPIYRG